MGAILGGTPKPPAPIIPPPPPTSVDPAVVEAASQARRAASSYAGTALTSPSGITTTGYTAKKTALGS